MQRHVCAPHICTHMNKHIHTYTHTHTNTRNILIPWYWILFPLFSFIYLFVWCGGGAGSPKSWGSNQTSDFQQTPLPIKQSHDILRVFKQQVWLVSSLVGFGVLVIEPKALPVSGRCSAIVLLPNSNILFYCFVRVCLCVRVCKCRYLCATEDTWRSENNFGESVLPSHCEFWVSNSGYKVCTASTFTCWIISQALILNSLSHMLS